MAMGKRVVARSETNILRFVKPDGPAIVTVNKERWWQSTRKERSQQYATTLQPALTGQVSVDDRLPPAAPDPRVASRVRRQRLLRFTAALRCQPFEARAAVDPGRPRWQSDAWPPLALPSHGFARVLVRGGGRRLLVGE